MNNIDIYNMITKIPLSCTRSCDSVKMFTYKSPKLLSIISQYFIGLIKRYSRELIQFIVNQMAEHAENR